MSPALVLLLSYAFAMMAIPRLGMQTVHLAGVALVVPVPLANFEQYPGDPSLNAPPVHLLFGACPLLGPGFQLTPTVF